MADVTDSNLSFINIFANMALIYKQNTDLEREKYRLPSKYNAPMSSVKIKFSKIGKKFCLQIFRVLSKVMNPGY